MVRYGIIGIGNMGSAHAKALYEGKIDSATLTAVSDTNIDRRTWAQNEFGAGIAVFEDYESLLTSGLVDAVIIATPHYSHPDIAKRAFKENLHVLIEKPAGVDTKSVKEMNRVAMENGKAFGIMFNQRTDALFGALKYYVELGLLGEIKRFNWIINNWYRTQAYYESSSWRASWNGEGGGVLLNQCPHNLDIWQWIMGMPTKVMAFCHEGQFHDVYVEDDATIYAEYPNKATATFITSTGEYPGTNRLEISGTMGKAVAENGVLKLFLLDKDERDICYNSTKSMPKEKVTQITVNIQEQVDGHILIIRNFTEHIENGKELIAPGLDGIKSLSISNAAYLSAWTGSFVDIPFDEDRFNELLEAKRQEEKEKGNAKNSVDIPSEAAGEYSDRWQVRW